MASKELCRPLFTKRLRSIYLKKILVPEFLLTGHLFTQALRLTPMTSLTLGSDCYINELEVIISKIIVCICWFRTDPIFNYRRQYLSRVNSNSLTPCRKLFHPHIW